MPSRREPVERASWLERVDAVRRVREADAGLRPPAFRVDLVERLVQHHVSLREPIEAREELHHAPRVGGQLSREVGLRRPDAGLVDRQPDADPLAERPGNSRREPLQPGDDAGVHPAAVAADPEGVGVVVEVDHREDARLRHGIHDASVVKDRILVEAAFFGFDPGPFDRHPERPVVHPPHQLDVVLVARPEAGRLGRVSAAGDESPLVQQPVLVVDDTAFDLPGRGAAPPEEAFREEVARHGHIRRS
jgi:hypothetical protein